MDDVGILKILQDEPFVALKERDLIETLKDHAITSSQTIPKGSYHMVAPCYNWAWSLLAK